ncbi:hypothetical protein StoSoilA2_26070 [Arthrobacter sp. StoSoilA2]|nr:hypothetical protein StoSoilA2_26070 [Arthrobacter sp. StoSoilA2]
MAVTGTIGVGSGSRRQTLAANGLSRPLELLNTSSLSGEEKTTIITEAWERPLQDSRTIRDSRKRTGCCERFTERISREERIVVRAAQLTRQQDIESPACVNGIEQRPV